MTTAIASRWPAPISGSARSSSASASSKWSPRPCRPTGSSTTRGNNLNVQAEAVKLAERQYESNRRQAEQGILAPVDVVAAQTQFATFQQTLFAAQQALTAAENNLKSMMLPNRSDLMWGMALIPETQLDADGERPALWRTPSNRRLASRPEIAETALAIDINSSISGWPARTHSPRIDAFANVTSAGLAGTRGPARLQSALGIAARRRTVPALLSGGYGQSLEQHLARELPHRAGRRAVLAADPQSHRRSAGRHRRAEGRRLGKVQDQVAMAVEADVRNALQAATEPRAPRCRGDRAPIRRRAVLERAAPVPGGHLQRLSGAAAPDRPDLRPQPRSPRPRRFRRGSRESGSRDREHYRGARHQAAVGGQVEATAREFCRLRRGQAGRPVLRTMRSLGVRNPAVLYGLWLAGRILLAGETGVSIADFDGANPLAGWTLSNDREFPRSRWIARASDRATRAGGRCSNTGSPVAAESRCGGAVAAIWTPSPNRLR